MKRLILLSGGVLGALTFYLARPARAADVYKETISITDGGPNFCSGTLGGARQFAIQCDGGVYATTCNNDAGGCTVTGATGVLVDPKAMYDIPMPRQHNAICITPDVAAASACRVYTVDPQQLKVAP